MMGARRTRGARGRIPIAGVRARPDVFERARGDDALLGRATVARRAHGGRTRDEC